MSGGEWPIAQNFMKSWIGKRRKMTGREDWREVGRLLHEAAGMTDRVMALVDGLDNPQK